MPPIKYYWEDFPRGWQYESPPRILTAQQILAFASEYDPQSYHTDEEAAKSSPFGGLIASGWQTCGVAMRLMCDGYLLETSCIGSPGLDELRWFKPVRPGDALRLHSIVLDQVPSQKDPARGTVQFRWDVLNQKDEVVCSMTGRQHFRRRAARTTVVGVHLDTSVRKSSPFPAFAVDAAKALIAVPATNGEQSTVAVAVRPAKAEDAPGIAACVCEAYVHYIERIGRQPGPMLEDYAEVIRQFQVHVAVAGASVLGAIVLKLTPEGFYVDNVSVRPALKGQGIGRMLLELAESEARRQEYDSIYLATHELMTENRALYSRAGYVEYGHHVVNGYPRVFFRKPLP